MNTNSLTPWHTVKGYTLDGNAYCKSCAEDGDASIFGTPFVDIDDTAGWVCASCRHFIDEPERIIVDPERARAVADIGGDYYIEVAIIDGTWHVTEYDKNTGYPWYKATYRTRNRAIADANSRLADEEFVAGIHHERFI